MCIQDKQVVSILRQICYAENPTNILHAAISNATDTIGHQRTPSNATDTSHFHQRIQIYICGTNIYRNNSKDIVALEEYL